MNAADKLVKIVVDDSCVWVILRSDTTRHVDGAGA